ncbi:6-phosphogluconolactonase [Anatilimnocola aggregata]|uniref:6-phosphogluconolactonase n=1 Tax=Anatilimnocola aggregata TaxID=2528021 RepID=A0A517Y6V8_9BACT|nr:lactonase family protein [Anatilimnocola aggregata]QDU25974.1 6-phosphogluconolactonase [Anatilimnocola aggregata]
MQAAETCLYISDSGSQSIVHYDLDEQTGKLKEVSRTNVGTAPGSLAVHSESRTLFASLRTNARIGSFKIEANGKLTPINETGLGTGANAAYVATNRKGNYLFAASYSAGRVTVHEIAKAGQIGDAPLQEVLTAKTAHSTILSPDENWLFVPHVAPNAIFQFKLDVASGKLTKQESAAGGKPGAGPRHLAVHPSGKFAFSSDESGSSCTLYSLDAEKGLKPLQTVSTLPEAYQGGNSTADVHVHPNGEFVWVSNRGHDSLAGFRFDVATGKLTAIGQTPTEKTPRSFGITPSGKYVFAGGEGTGKLAAYSVDSKTGKLERTDTYDVGKSLSWVEIVTLP